MGDSDQTTSQGQGAFRTTHWSLVLAACQRDSPEAREALSKLCEIYWYPVYAFIRRQGRDAEQAKDLTQELFARLLERHTFEVADREKGRFRSFLLKCVQCFLSGERQKEQTLKRGGQYVFVPLDEALAEHQYGAEPADPASPEMLFDRRWALTLLNRAMDRLKRDYDQAGKGAQFEVLREFLSGTGGGTASYAEAAARLGLGEGAARQAAHRLRCRFGDMLREVVAETVAGPKELEAELADLRAIFSQ
jgi:RNA polymerase sigma-70 factor (ECF subfamily)